MRFNKVVNGHKVEIRLHEVHQYKVRDRGLRTWERETHISSRWFKVEGETIDNFKVKIKGFDKEAEAEAMARAIAKVEKMEAHEEEAESVEIPSPEGKIMADDYFSTEEHEFMNAVTETLEECESIIWDDNEPHTIAPDVLTDWQYAEVSDKAVYNLYHQPTSPYELAKALGITHDDVVAKINTHMAALPYGSFRLEL